MHIGPRILCVENNTDISEMLNYLLSRAGYKVVITHGVGEALHQAGKSCFDLFMLNIRYTDGDGIGLCEKLRQCDKNTPILFFAATGNTFERELAIKAGAQAFLEQPGHLDKLLETIKLLIDKGIELSVNSRSAST